MNQAFKVLVVDDETSIRRVVRINLEPKGFMVEEAATAHEGLAKVISFKPNLIILDLGLPDKNGLEVLESIRSWSKVPIIILTVSDDLESKVALLEAGADDYMTKPFNLPELTARIQVALRHQQPEVEARPVVEYGTIRVDLVKREITVGGVAVHLTVTEFNLLKVLIKGGGQVVPQEQVLSQVWGIHAVGSPHYLRIYIAQLRKKLEADPSAPKHIITEPGVGYRII